MHTHTVMTFWCCVFKLFHVYMFLWAFYIFIFQFILKAVSCPDLILRPHLVQPIRVSGYQSNDNITFVCGVGYSLIGNRWIPCTASGQWSGSVPTCDRRYFFQDETNAYYILHTKKS